MDEETETTATSVAPPPAAPRPPPAPLAPPSSNAPPSTNDGFQRGGADPARLVATLEALRNRAYRDSFTTDRPQLWRFLLEDCNFNPDLAGEYDFTALFEAKRFSCPEGVEEMPGFEEIPLDEDEPDSYAPGILSPVSILPPPHHARG